MTQPTTQPNLAMLSAIPHSSGHTKIRGEQVFLKSGSFTVPSGVTRVCVVCIGAGHVTGPTSSFGAFLSAGNLSAGTTTAISAALQIGGGDGGAASARAGGGAGGYMGNGGAGGPASTVGFAGAAGSGAAGGGGGIGATDGCPGGGVGPWGIGTTGGTSSQGGQAGSGGSDGSTGTENGGGLFGGGGVVSATLGRGGGNLRWRNNIDVVPGQVITVTVGAIIADPTSNGGQGCVRVIWGDGRSFPSNAS